MHLMLFKCTMPLVWLRHIDILGGMRQFIGSKEELGSMDVVDWHQCLCIPPAQPYMQEKQGMA